MHTGPDGSTQKGPQQLQRPAFRKHVKDPNCIEHLAHQVFQVEKQRLAVLSQNFFLVALRQVVEICKLMEGRVAAGSGTRTYTAFVEARMTFPETHNTHRPPCAAKRNSSLPIRFTMGLLSSLL
ncbi:hypothetical protein EYF80_022517 [Liparis tanakae]|uniref:Uncharacterized protein n=1 Tax=Liparis tanakae TaxID=230148 RepID=A0A4Z2HN36_9TELE|nr:hypothetical protein EYF80_022517 [Liparis tanakae]